MAKDKKSFIAYSDWKETFDKLPDELAGKLIKHIFAYVNDENPISEDFVIEAVFANIKNTLKRDLSKWETQLNQRSEAGKKSALVRKAKSDEASSTKSNERSISFNETTRNLTDSVSVSVSVNESDNEEKIQPPFLEQKKHLIPEMANKFKDINSNYAFDEVIDYPAIKSFAEFIANRQNKSRVISDLNLTQIDNIVNEFGKIANWYKNTNCTKSLETLAKFEIQKIFNELAQSGQVGGGIKLTTKISLT